MEVGATLQLGSQKSRKLYIQSVKENYCYVHCYANRNRNIVMWRAIRGVSLCKRLMK